MAKKANLKLEELRVESFLTQLEDEKKEKVKGGCGPTYPGSCAVTYTCTNSLNMMVCCVD
jgi:hypothetical protein